jgi:hypothetical protein
MITRLKEAINLSASFDDLNEAIGHLQSEIGVSSGDNAGIYFSGYDMNDKWSSRWVSATESERKDILFNYFIFEFNLLP